MSILDVVPAKPNAKQKKKYYGDAFIKKYLDEFEVHCWNHPIYAKLSLHLIMGQLPNINKMKIYYTSHNIDPRVHVCYISPSGTGKGAGANFISKVAKSLGMKVASIETVTDAGLVGSVTLTYEYDPQKKTTIKVPKYEHGILSEHYGLNLLIYTEASVLFTQRPSQYIQHSMDYLQKAMNPMGTEDNTIAKKSGIGDQIIEIHPTLSILMTTYEPPHLYDVLTNRGLLQRMAFYVNRVNLKEYSKNADRQIDNLLNQKNQSGTRFSEIIETFRNIDKYYEGIETLEITDEARKGLKSIKRRMYDHIKRIGDPEKRQAMIKFLPRQLELAFKFAFHHALTRLSKTIEMEDILYSKELTLALWKNITSFIEEKMVAKSMGTTSKLKRMKIIQSIVANAKTNSWRAIMTAIEEKLAVTPETANNLLEEAKEAGYIVVEKGKVKVGRDIKGI